MVNAPRKSSRGLVPLVAAMAAIATPLAHAASITVDFESPPGQQILINNNFTENGFRFSPNCHYDRVSGSAFDGSIWMGFDASSCGVLNNPNFTGPAAMAGGPPAVMYVDYTSGLFTLNSFWVQSPGLTVTSSNGGFASFNTTGGELATFTGAAWTNISWLLFGATNDFGFPHGFDHFIADVGTASVPEPATSALLLLSVAGVAFVRRRKVTA